MKKFDTGMRKMIDRDELDRISLEKLFGDKVEEFNLDILEDRNDGFSIIGYYPKNIFTFKEEVIALIEKELNLKSVLKGEDYQVSVPYISSDFNVPFVIDIKNKKQEESSCRYNHENSDRTLHVNDRVKIKDKGDKISTKPDEISCKRIKKSSESTGSTIDVDFKIDSSDYKQYDKNIDNILNYLVEIADEDKIEITEDSNDNETKVHLHFQLKEGNYDSNIHFFDFMDEDLVSMGAYDIEIRETTLEGSEEVTPEELEELQDIAQELSSEEKDKIYEKYLKDFKTMPVETFKKEYSSLRYKRMVNKGEPLSKEKFLDIYTSSVNFYQVNRRIPNLNKNLEDLELVAIKDEENDVCFYIINPDANMEEYLEVLDWLDDRGVDIDSFNTDISNVSMARNNPDLVDLGYGGGDTYIAIWAWKDV